MLNLLFTAASAKTEEKKCRPGWELHGDLCRQWNQVDLAPWCEKGSYIKGICVVDYQPYAQCINEGYLVNGMCEHYHMEKAISVCPDHYKLKFQGHEKENAYCESVTSVNVLEDCPDGTIEIGRQCQSYGYADQTYVCPDGQNLDGMYCVHIEFYDCLQPTFPHGTSKKHLKSHGHHRRLGKKDSADQYAVPDVYGEEDHLISAVCERENRTLAVASCPEGSFRFGKQCKIQKIQNRENVEMATAQRAPLESTCPIPYQWCESKTKHSDSSCCLTEVEEPVWECPSGTFMTQTGCVGKFEPLYICADGSKKNKQESCSEWRYEEPVVIVVSTFEEKKKKHHHH